MYGQQLSSACSGCLECAEETCRLSLAVGWTDDKMANLLNVVEHLASTGKWAGKCRFAHLSLLEIEAKKKSLVPKSTQKANDLAARMMKDYMKEFGTNATPTETSRRTLRCQYRASIVSFCAFKMSA